LTFRNVTEHDENLIGLISRPCDGDTPAEALLSTHQIVIYISIRIEGPSEDARIIIFSDDSDVLRFGTDLIALKDVGVQLFIYTTIAIIILTIADLSAGLYRPLTDHLSILADLDALLADPLVAATHLIHPLKALISSTITVVVLTVTDLLLCVGEQHLFALYILTALPSSISATDADAHGTVAHINGAWRIAAWFTILALFIYLTIAIIIDAVSTDLIYRLTASTLAAIKAAIYTGASTQTTGLIATLFKEVLVGIPVTIIILPIAGLRSGTLCITTHPVA